MLTIEDIQRKSKEILDLQMEQAKEWQKQLANEKLELLKLTDIKDFNIEEKFKEIPDTIQKSVESRQELIKSQMEAWFQLTKSK